jgi:hypothetical protein
VQLFLVQIVDVIHPGRPNVSKNELKEKIAAMYKVNDGLAVVLFGFKTKFGGGRSTGIVAKLFAVSFLRSISRVCCMPSDSLWLGLFHALRAAVGPCVSRQTPTNVDSARATRKDSQVPAGVP